MENPAHICVQINRQHFTLPAARLSRHFRGSLLHCRSHEVLPQGLGLGWWSLYLPYSGSGLDHLTDPTVTNTPEGYGRDYDVFSITSEP
jgi:hypothetical protein